MNRQEGDELRKKLIGRSFTRTKYGPCDWVLQIRDIHISFDHRAVHNGKNLFAVQILVVPVGSDDTFDLNDIMILD